MKTGNIHTQFAPAERADEKIIKHQSDILADQPILIEILNAVSVAVVILNLQRQIVFGNKAFLYMLGRDDLKGVSGLRVGEVMKCIHASTGAGGCGTTKFCKMCGAVNAMLSAQKGNIEILECRITQLEDTRAFDLRVMASPINIKGMEFTVFSVMDIADEKRKEVLERIFLHDLMNTANGLQGYSRLLTTSTEDDLTRYSMIVNKLADKLVDEIEAQKQLIQAENNRLIASLSTINSLYVLTRVKETYMNHDVAIERTIIIDPESQGTIFSSDETLLLRVIGNMTKNALEAIGPQESVTLSCRIINDKIRFSVHNLGEIPQEARLQVFQRSFSTKGAGRGLGTYSIKLLSEQYLK